MNKECLPPAIVIGLDSFTGLQTARILASHKIPVIAMTKRPDHYCCKTKVCERIIPVDTETDDLVSALSSLGTSFIEKPVLFPCADTSVLALARHQDSLRKWYRLILPEPEIIEMLVDKVRFYGYAGENGFPVPCSLFLYSREDAQKAIDSLTFPCILKPPYKPKVWTMNTKEKAFKIDRPDDFLPIYDQCSQWTDVLIAQQWIEGGDLQHMTCNAYFGENGEPLVTFTTRKLRQWPPKTGQGCFAEEYRDEYVESTTIRFFQNLRFHGLAYLEMKKDAVSGEYYIIEPNVGRPTGRSATAEASGVALLYTMYCDALGKPLPENRKQNYQGVKWIYLRPDIQSAFYSIRRKELSVWEWLLSLRGQKAYAIFSWEDPAPFFYDFFRFVKMFLSKFKEKTRKGVP